MSTRRHKLRSMYLSIWNAIYPAIRYPSLQPSSRHLDMSSSLRSRRQIRIGNLALGRRRLRQRPALLARPPLLAIPKPIDGLLDLRAQIRAVEGRLLDHALAVRAVPAQAVDAVGGALLLEHDADGVGEAHRVVRRVGRQKEHAALRDQDVAEDAVVDDLEQHRALVLVEPLGRRVDVVVGARVWAADDLGMALDGSLERRRVPEENAP